MSASASSTSASASASAASSGDALAAALAAEAAEYSAQHPNDARLASKGHVRDVDISDVSVTLPNGTDLLSLTRLTLRQGARYGMVGKNGIGKSVLLRRMATGRIGGWPANLRCHLVEQEVPGNERSALQVVIESDTTRTALMAREKVLLQRIAEQGSNQAAAASKAPPSAASSASSSSSRSGPAPSSDPESQLAEIYDHLTTIDADSAEARAAEILDDIGFTVEMQARPTKLMSGGYRMRVSLACALFNQPDILLLDEPTNHLDLHGVVWLTEYLNSLDCTVLVVSHDARFLADVTTDIIHFHNQALHYYSGNFDAFVKYKAEGERNIQRQQEALDSKRAHIRESMEKMKAQAKKTGHSEMKLGGVASRQKKLGRMGFEKTADGKKFNAQLHGRRQGAINNSGMTTSGSKDRREALSCIEPPEPGFRFSFPDADMESIGAEGVLLTVKDVSFGFGARKAAAKGKGKEVQEELDMDPIRADARAFQAETQRALLEALPPPIPNYASAPLLFANLDLVIRAGQKVGVVGRNGQGKSTLLSLLGGLLDPSSGEVVRHPDMRVAYFSQHLVEQLDLRLTPVQHILALPEASSMASGPNAEQAARAVLGRFGLAGGLALAPMGTLSGGQKARVLFASITIQRPQLLLLDEPTNHLDLVTTQALLDALREFAGAAIWVSHDQQLMEACGELWLVEERVAPKQAKLNPNQLQAAATKAKKEQAAAAAAAAKKGRSGAAAASSSSAATPAEKLTFPSRCSVRKLAVSFEEYRESILDDL